MKKLIYLCALGLSVGSRAGAQSMVLGENWRLGLYLAPNISWMHPTASKDNSGQFNVKGNGSRVGFTYGLMTEYSFQPNYALVTGLQINATGGKVLTTRVANSTVSGAYVSSADFKYKLQYLEIPVALKMKTNEIQGFKFFGQVGVSIGFNIGKKGNFTVDYTDDNGIAQSYTGTNEAIKGSVAIAPVMMQMNIGAGVERVLSDQLTAYFGLFFNNGFLPDATKPKNYKLEYQGKFDDGNVRLNNLAFRFGLFF